MILQKENVAKVRKSFLKVIIDLMLHLQAPPSNGGWTLQIIYVSMLLDPIFLDFLKVSRFALEIIHLPGLHTFQVYVRVQHPSQTSSWW